MTTHSTCGESLTPEYAARLDRIGRSRWRKLLNVQAPYRSNLRRLAPGFTLDVGCGVGRNLAHLDGLAVGVDANADCVARCRTRGFAAYLPNEFASRAALGEFPEFDSVLVAHVLEHLPQEAADNLVSEYLQYLKPQGRLILMTPQEAGYRSDPTHVRFVDGDSLVAMCKQHGLRIERNYSFPFPRAAGRFFRYNEFVVVGSSVGRA
jgi:SAM-dependent methyltransferase